MGQYSTRHSSAGFSNFSTLSSIKLSWVCITQVGLKGWASEPAVAYTPTLLPFCHIPFSIPHTCKLILGMI